MKLPLVVCSLFISLCCFSQAPKQGLRITVKEKTKGEAELYVQNTPVTITLNDSLKYNLTTDSDGRLHLEVPAGTYKVAVTKDSCMTSVTKGVMVGLGKTSYLIYELTCEQYINSLSKKERKELGIEPLKKKKN